MSQRSTIETYLMFNTAQTSRQLADKTNIPAPSVRRELQNLQRSGLVRRVENDPDAGTGYVRN